MKRKALKGGAILSVGQLVSQGCSFLRNVILARLVSQADFGVAATFALTIALLDMLSNMAIDKLLVQAEYGNDAEFQRTAHSLQFLRGLFGGVMIFLLAQPMSWLFGVPDKAWAYACLGLVPVLRGLGHLDLYRLQREMKFKPVVATEVTTHVGSLILIVPLAYGLKDYTAMLWATIAQAALAAIMSHVVAERRYGWKWNPVFARRILNFGWPLLINGLLMFGILQGDRLAIGSAAQMFGSPGYSLADLGVYSAAFALTLTPTLITASVSTSVLLPVLSQTRQDREKLQQLCILGGQIIALVAFCIALPFVVAGDRITIAVYGDSYAATASFIGWLAAMQAVRVLRIMPTLVAMAFAETKNAMYSNIIRSSSFGLTLWVTSLAMPFSWVAAAGLAGELGAFVFSAFRLQMRNGVPAYLFFKPAALTVLLVLLFVPWSEAIARLGAGSQAVLLACVFSAGVATMGFCFPRLRDLVVRTILDLISGRLRLNQV